MAKQKNIDWSSVDWSRPTTTIASEFGIHMATVSAQRRRYAPDTLGKRNPSYVLRPAEAIRSSDSESREFSLARLRALKVNPLVRLNGETRFVNSLKNLRGGEIVKVTLGEFNRAFEARRKELWG